MEKFTLSPPSGGSNGYSCILKTGKVDSGIQLNNSKTCLEDLYYNHPVPETGAETNFDSLISPFRTTGVLVPIITPQDAEKIFKEPDRTQLPSWFADRHAEELAAKFPNLKVAIYYPPGSLMLFEVGGVSTESIEYVVDELTGLMVCVADQKVPRVKAGEVLQILPPTVETFRMVNAISREVLFTSGANKSEFRWTLEAGETPGTPKTNYRLMVGSMKEGKTAVRLFTGNRENPARKLPRFFSVLQMLGTNYETLSVIDYPLAYRTASSAAVIIEHLLGNSTYSVGILGVGETARTLLLSLAALPKPPEQIKITARGKNGYPSVAERLEYELGSLPGDISQRLRPVETIGETMSTEVLCDLASGYHDLTSRPGKLRLYLTVSGRAGGPKLGFDFTHHYFDAYSQEEAARSTHPLLGLGAYKYLGKSDFVNIKEAPSGLLVDPSETATCTVIGSPVIDLRIGQKIMERVLAREN